MMKAQINTLLIPRDFPEAIFRALVVVCFVTIPSVCVAQEEAVSECRVAAEQGDTDEQYNLGVRYRDGQGVAQDYEFECRWFDPPGSVITESSEFNQSIIRETAQIESIVST